MSYVEEYRRMGATSEAVDVAPVVVVGFLDDMGHLCVTHVDEEEMAEAMEFYYNEWQRSTWPHYMLLEIKT